MKRLSLVIFLFQFLSCQKVNNDASLVSGVKQFLVLGHTYQWAADGSKLDTRLEDLNYSLFDAVWLGGDMCSETTREESTIQYLDDIFDLANPETLWTVGNHDIRNGNLDLIRKYTGRDLYYRHKIDSIEILNMNSIVEHPAYDNCEEREKQGAFIHNFIDDCLERYQEIKYVLVFSHIAVWSDTDPYFKNFEKVGNQSGNWVDFYCEQSSLFKNEFAPRFFELADKGVELIFVAGDGGQYLKTFHYHSPKGIHYYVTGINNSIWATENPEKIAEYNTDPDSVLIMNYQMSNDSLWGEFVPLTSLE